MSDVATMPSRQEMDPVVEELRRHFDGSFVNGDNVTAFERLGVDEESARYLADFLGCVRILHNCKCMADAASAFMRGNTKEIKSNFDFEGLGSRERAIAMWMAFRMTEYEAA